MRWWWWVLASWAAGNAIVFAWAWMTCREDGDDYDVYPKRSHPKPGRDDRCAERKGRSARRSA